MKNAYRKLNSVTLAMAMIACAISAPVFTVSADETEPETTTQIEETEESSSKETEKPSEETTKPSEETTESSAETQKPAEETTETSEPEPSETKPETPETKKDTDIEPANGTEAPATETPETEAPKDSDKADTETDSKLPKNAQDAGAITNVKFENGTMTWDAYTGAQRYYIYICGVYAIVHSPSYFLDAQIDYLVLYGKIKKSDSYQIDIEALDSNSDIIAKWSGTYSYNTPATRVKTGAITNVKFNNGIMSWDEYPVLASKTPCYMIYVDDYCVGEASVYHPPVDSFEINKYIDGKIKWGHIEKRSTYKIDLKLFSIGLQEEGVLVAQWSGTYTYNSPYKYGKISDVKIKDGVITWGNYKGTDTYRVWIDTYENGMYGTSVGGRCDDLNDSISVLLRFNLIRKKDVYKIRIVALDADEYCIAQWSGSFTYNRAKNTLDVKGKTAKVKYSKLKKKKQKLSVSKVISFVDKGQGTLTYAKVSGKKKISINKNTGTVTIKKKGLKKGSYKVKVKVMAAGNNDYKPSAWKTVTFTIKVKK